MMSQGQSEFSENQEQWIKLSRASAKGHSLRDDVFTILYILFEDTLFLFFYYICNTLDIRIFVNVFSMCFLFFISDWSNNNSNNKNNNKNNREARVLIS